MSENWVTLTAEDVLAPGSAERVAIVAIKQRDDLGEICGEVTSQVRQAYAFSNRDLGDDGTIPEGLKAKAIAIALWRFVSEGVAKNDGIQTKGREAAATAAVKYLDQIAAAEIGKVSAPSVGKRRRKFTKCEEEGI